MAVFKPFESSLSGLGQQEAAGLMAVLEAVKMADAIFHQAIRVKSDDERVKEIEKELQDLFCHVCELGKAICANNLAQINASERAHLN